MSVMAKFRINGGLWEFPVTGGLPLLRTSQHTGNNLQSRVNARTTEKVMLTLGYKFCQNHQAVIHKCLPWKSHYNEKFSWWRHQMKTFSAFLALCAGNSPVTGELPAHRPMTQSFDVFFDLGLNKRVSKQSWDWWFETPSHSLWRHCSVTDGHTWQ